MSTWNSVQGSLGWNPPGQKGTSVSFYPCAQKIISLTCRLSARAWSFHNTDEFVICLPALMKRLSVCVARSSRRIFSVSRRYAAIWLTFSVGVKGRGHPKVNRALASPSEVSVDATWQSCLPMFPLTLSRCLIVSENDAYEDERKQGKYSRLLLNKELVIFFILQPAVAFYDTVTVHSVKNILHILWHVQAIVLGTSHPDK